MSTASSSHPRTSDRRGTITRSSTRHRSLDVTKPLPRSLHRRFGPTALVTGASEGIGRAFAVALARHGFDLVLVARREDRLLELATELRRLHGVTVRIVATDLSIPGSHRALLDATAEETIGLVVAAAGYGSVGSFLERPLDEEATMIDLNCRSVVELAHGFGRRMASARRGGLVLFGSLVGFSGAPGSATYAATKGFVQSFAEGLAVELRPLGVSVMSVAPGPVASGFAARAGMQLSFSQTPDVVAAGALAALGHRTTVRPGGLSKLLGWSLGMLPRRGRVRVLGALMKGMTAQASSTGRAT
jgi:short-subunit dehydrogenase